MSKSLFWVCIILCIYSNLNAQCNEQATIKTILNTRELAPIQKLIQEIKHCPELSDSLALAYHTLGIVYYNEDQLDQAIAANHKAIEIRASLNPPPLFDLAKSNHNLGVFYKNKEDLKQAVDYFSTAVQLYDQLDTPRVISSYKELADVADRKGDYMRSAQLLKIAIQRSKQFKDELNLANCYLDLSSILIDQKKYLEAIQYLNPAQEIFKRNDYQEELAKCQINLAKAYFKQKEYSKASMHNETAAQLLRKLDDKTELSKTLNNLSVVYLKQKNFTKAEKTAKQGLSIALATKASREISQSYNNLAEISLAQKQFEQALSYFQKDGNALIAGFDENDFTVNPSKKQLDLVANKIDLLKSLNDKARAWKAFHQSVGQENYLQHALKIYTLTDYLVDQIRKEQINETSKLFWRENVVAMYEQAIQLCYTLKDTKGAFYFFEKSKSILLLEGLLHAQALDIIPDSIARKEFQLRQQLLYAKEDLENIDPNTKAKALEKVLHLQEQLFQFTQQISQQYPQYFNIKYQSEVVSLNDLKHNLEEDAVFLHFFNGQENNYLLCIDKQQERFIQLGKTAELNLVINDFLRFFQQASTIEQDPEAYTQTAFTLYQKLLNAVDLKAKSELIIIPDGLLNFVPFEALIDQSKQANLASQAYLIRKYKIRYSYSGTILSKQETNQKNSNTKFLAFAPFATHAADNNYGDLNYTKDELSSIENKITGTFYKDEEASKASFFQQAPTASIIHLSTHALANADSLQARIVFSDTLLFLSELYGLELNADLLVLSACQTNIGKIQSGEGVMSMARGFTYAGARSQISSLWKVNAATTGKIFTDFYAELLAGRSAAQAFYQAKLNHLDDPNIRPSQKSPYYWAGFVFIGPDRLISIDTNTRSYMLSITLISLLLILGLFYFFKRMR